MRIRVAILDKDQNYQNRLLEALREKFYNKLEVFLCNDSSDVLNAFESHDVNVLAINHMCKCDISETPESCVVIYLTETKLEEDIDSIPTMCKYQKVSDICKTLYDLGNNHLKILEAKKEAERRAEEERLEAERKAEEERIRQEEEKKAEEERIAARRSNPDIYAFISAGREEGSTSASIAFAMSRFGTNCNVLYLDFKQFSGMERFFDVRDKMVSFSEILEKAVKNELTVKDLEEAIVTDEDNEFDLIINTKCAFELVMLGENGFESLINKIREMVRYDIVIINLDSGVSQLNLSVINAARKVIFVGNGTENSNDNIERTVNVIIRYDEVNDTNNVNKVNILYNRFVNRNCSVLRLDNVDVLGNLGVIKEKTEIRVIERMSNMSAIRQIVEESVV